MSKHNRVETTMLLEPVSYQKTPKGEYTLMRCPECHELVPAWINCEECGWSRVASEGGQDHVQSTLGDS